MKNKLDGKEKISGNQGWDFFILFFLNKKIDDFFRFSFILLIFFFAFSSNY